MIYVQLNGGLGNQLFQYAMGRSLSIKFSTSLYLDISLYDQTDSKYSKRKYELNIFPNLKAETIILKSTLIKSLKFFPSTPFKIFGIYYVYENNLKSIADKSLIKNDSLLIGYWQKYEYFSNIDAFLYDDLHFSNLYSSETANVLAYINSCNSLALHVRRGDYISNIKAKNFHGSLSLDYYLASIHLALDSDPNLIFFIFSDDIEWCRENLPIPSNNCFFVAHNSSNNSWEDLFLMSHCKNHIIANSSFSWWGAWFADQRFSNNRLVVAPARWFLLDKLSSPDRFPPHWALV